MFLSPYTKVEESFNLQAIHDILNYGIGPDQIDFYDHKQFPGVVPRTFVGSLLVSGIVSPLVWLIKLVTGRNLLEGDQSTLQLLVRAVIGLANGFLLIHLGTSVTKIDFVARKFKKKSIIANCYMLMVLSQFHILYYSSRTLPNFMALPFVNYGLSKMVAGDITGLTWLAFTGIVFRIEVGVFSFLIAVSSVGFFQQSDIFLTILMLAVGTIIGTIVSGSVDSYFWGRLIIPELQSLQYNVVEGKAANWGVEPFQAYFNKYIPQLFRPPAVLMLAIIGLSTDPSDDGTVVTDPKTKQTIHRPSKNSLKILCVGSLLYVIIMSAQPHKEWRFIIYVVPVISIFAGNGLATLIARSKESFARKFLVFVFLVLTLAAGLVSAFMGYASSYNYPGGEALKLINQLTKNVDEKTKIHLDVATCMSGASRFGEVHNDLVVYDKTEPDIGESWFLFDFDYLVTEITRDHPFAQSWEKQAVIPAFKDVSPVPVLNWIQQYNSPKDIVGDLVNISVEAFKTKDFSKIKELLDIPIIKEDSLSVYKRFEIGPVPLLHLEDYSKLGKFSLEELADSMFEEVANHRKESGLEENPMDDMLEDLLAQLESLGENEDPELAKPKVDDMLGDFFQELEGMLKAEIPGLKNEEKSGLENTEEDMPGLEEMDEMMKMLLKEMESIVKAEQPGLEKEGKPGLEEFSMDDMMAELLKELEGMAAAENMEQ